MIRGGFSERRVWRLRFLGVVASPWLRGWVRDILMTTHAAQRHEAHTSLQSSLQEKKQANKCVPVITAPRHPR